METIATRIARHQTHLTRKERQIARVLVADSPTRGLETVAELGRRASASGATILRFIAKLGFTGYPEFQEALRHELNATLESPLARYRAADERLGGSDMLARYADWSAMLMRQTADLVPTPEFEAIERLLENTRISISVVGGRFSRSIAELFCYGLSNLRSNVRHIEDDERALVHALLEIRKRDVVIVFDFRRYQENIVNFAGLAADAGATLVVITDKWQSPCAKRAQHVLALPVASPSIYDSALAPILCVEALVALLAERLGPVTEEHTGRVDTLYRQLSV
ncbi:MAG: MurR/RpiR family transcriptional regulator [Rhizobiaceae bacterium]|nr:MurR/RpiR family transcriptional regulator [Rhizobiaceae bacterium]